MTHTRREWSRSERMVAAAFVGALLGLWAPMPAAAEGDKPAPPPTIFELTKPQVPSAIKGMSDSVRLEDPLLHGRRRRGQEALPDRVGHALDRGGNLRLRQLEDRGHVRLGPGEPP